MSSLGAFGLGLVIGWLVYFTNRYRKGEVQFSDITSLLGIIGGAAVTSLFGEAKNDLLGAYGIGLTVGFFLYFAVLVFAVRNSGGDFTWAWFLDGRRKKLVDPWEIPAGTREQAAAMDLGPVTDRLDRLEGALSSLAPPPGDLAPLAATATPSPLALAAGEKSDGIEAARQAIIDLGRIIDQTTDDALRTQLRQQSEWLSEKLGELIAVRLRDRIDNDETQSALRTLRGITGDLKTEAGKMKQTADALGTAAKVINQIEKLIGFLGGAFV